MEVVFNSIENVLFPDWGWSHQVRISEVLLYWGTGEIVLEVQNWRLTFTS